MIADTVMVAPAGAAADVLTKSATKAGAYTRSLLSST
jgi:hypothetical protein